MKKKSPLIKIRLLLEHLESNIYSSEKRTAEVLEKSFPPKNDFGKVLKMCTEKRFIQWVQEDKTFEITIEGLEFLSKLRDIDRDNKSSSMQKQLVITNIILALTSTIMLKYNINRNGGLDLLSFLIIIIILTLIALNIKEWFTL